MKMEKHLTQNKDLHQSYQRRIRTYINFKQRKIRTYERFKNTEIVLGTYCIRVYVMPLGTVAPINRVSFACPVFLTPVI